MGSIIAGTNCSAISALWSSDRSTNVSMSRSATCRMQSKGDVRTAVPGRWGPFALGAQSTDVSRYKHQQRLP